jgi:acyl-CoA reductase-like NAD-dependent aldehyde dehydrogenase
MYFKKYFVEPEPYGVVAVIGPWNYPVVQVMTPILAALMAGNVVIVKPSEAAPAVGELFAKLFAAVPEIAPYVRVLHGGPEVGKQIVAEPPDLIFVTGSEKTGMAITQAAAAHLTPVIAELGGKDPMIVLEDANIREAAKWGVWAANYHSGQVCMSVERVYVVESVYEAFVTAVVEEAQKFSIGYTTDVDSPYNCGPISFERQLGIIETHLQDAADKGAKTLTGGRRAGMFIDPVVLVDVDHQMKIMQEETFGPVMPIMKVRDEAEAIALANDSEYGLCAYVWSQDLRRAERVARQLEAGSVVINDAMAHYAVSQLPFGGVKKSGNGRIHGEEEVKQFTQSKGYAVGATPFRWDIATVFRSPGHYKEMRALMRVAFGSWRQKFAPWQDGYPLTEPVATSLPVPEVTTPKPIAPVVQKMAVVAGVAAVTAVVLWAVSRKL